MRLLCFGYIKICHKDTSKVHLGKPVVFKSAYYKVDLTEIIEDIGLDSLIIKLEKRALRKMQGCSLVLLDGEREARVSLAGIDISKPLVITDLEQYFIASAKKEDLSQCCNYEKTFLFDEEWLLKNQEYFNNLLLVKA